MIRAYGQNIATVSAISADEITRQHGIRWRRMGIISENPGERILRTLWIRTCMRSFVWKPAAIFLPELLVASHVEQAFFRARASPVLRFKFVIAGDNQMTLVRICHILETSGGGSGQVVLALARHGISQE